VTVDLHIHSTASDGTLTPGQIVNRACHLGLAAIALTDHDTVAGVQQILPCIPSTIQFLTGVELSTAPPPGFPCQGSLHLLGYGFQPDHPEVTQALCKLQAARHERNPQIVARLQALGIDISLEELETSDHGRQTGRPHIARLLLEKGVVASFEEAFDRFIGNGRPAYVDKYRIDVAQAIALIRRAKGIAVLAHPALIAPHLPWRLEDLIGELKAFGLQGLEAYYPEHTEAQTHHLLALAGRHGLLVTGGTDFHGAIKPGVEMGSADGHFKVPFDVYQQLAARLQAQDSPS
jgi:predicted metal-dependent phosphoesterase TrpH